MVEDLQTNKTPTEIYQTFSTPANEDEQRYGPANFAYLPYKEAVVYDIACPDTAVDKEDAEDVVALKLEFSKTDCSKDKKCLYKGSQWSTIYLANGILLLLIALNMICVGVGSYKAMPRLIGAWVAQILCCAHFAIIIVTAVFRFSIAGRLCAMNNVWTSAPSSDADDVSDAWTMKKDGSLILALWILQLLFCCCCCGAGMAPMAPPKGNMNTL